MKKLILLFPAQEILLLKLMIKILFSWKKHEAFIIKREYKRHISISN